MIYLYLVHYVSCLLLIKLILFGKINTANDIYTNHLCTWSCRSKLKSFVLVKKPKTVKLQKRKLSNIKIFINEHIINNFVCYYFCAGVVLKKQFNFGLLLIKICKNDIKIQTRFSVDKCVKILTINYVKQPSKNYLKSTNKSIVIHTKVYNKISCFKVVSYTKFDCNDFCCNFKIFKAMQCAMQPIISGFIPCNLKGDKKLNCDIMLLDFIQSIRQFKVYTSNKYLNNLINSFLPNRVISQISNFGNLGGFVYGKLNTKYNWKTVADYLLKQRKYILLYNYLLCNYLGVCFLNNSVVFFNNRFYFPGFKIEYKNETFLVNNLSNSVSVLYNGIVYNNINAIKLQSINNIKFDN